MTNPKRSLNRFWCRSCGMIARGEDGGPPAKKFYEPCRENIRGEHDWVLLKRVGKIP